MSCFIINSFIALRLEYKKTSQPWSLPEYLCLKLATETLSTTKMSCYDVLLCNPKQAYSVRLTPRKMFLQLHCYRLIFCRASLNGNKFLHNFSGSHYLGDEGFRDLHNSASCRSLVSHALALVCRASKPERGGGLQHLLSTGSLLHSLETPHCSQGWHQAFLHPRQG